MEVNIITSKLKNTIIFLSLFFCFATFFVNSKAMTENIISTMLFCFNKLIPSIFPSMITASIFACYYSSKNNKQQKKFLGIDKQYFSIIVPAWISGFLIGPKILSKNASQSDITDYVIITSNAGIGFVASLVGITLWNNIFFGLYLYGIQIALSIALFNLTKKNHTKTLEMNFTHKPALTVITDSISQSTKTMLDICGFTVFFSVVRFSIFALIKVKENSVFYIIISSLLEISNGVLISSTNANNSLAGFFTGFCIGFGGICIITQTLSMCENKICASKFFIVKFIQGIICGIFSLLYVKIFSLCATNSVFTSLSYDTGINSIIINCIFIFLLLNYIKKSIFIHI